MIRGRPARTALVWMLCTMATVNVNGAGRAHRLDEYLQATRIDIGIDQVQLQLDLTPGAEIFESVLVTLDGDRDGQIEPIEADGYVTLVLRHLTLSVDGNPLPINLQKRQIPSIPEMAAGTGVIRIEAVAPYTAGADSRHTLEFHNNLRPDIGVYLVNAVIPSTSAIRITGQKRDPQQRSLTLDYEIERSGGTLFTIAWIVVAGAVIALAVWSRKRRRTLHTLL